MNKRDKRNLEISNFTLKSLKWLATQEIGIAGLPKTMEKIHRKFFEINKTRGTTEAIKYIKNLRAQVYQLLSWSSDGVFLNAKVKVSKDLRFLLKRENSWSPAEIKLLLTVLLISKIFKSKPQASFETITGPDERKYPNPISNQDCKRFWKSLGYNPKRQPSRPLEWNGYHRSSKAGPNGHALMKSIVDLVALTHYPQVLEDIKILGGKRLTKYIMTLMAYLPSLMFLVPKATTIIRKLLVLADKEGKTREVAQFDYFSMTSLRPLHKYLFRALSKIRQDCTFNQTKFYDLLGTQSEEPYYSIDLRAFTDRFPVDLNHKLLKVKIGKKRADAWLRVMTQEFTFKDRLISYSVGNPMGAYSSWNSTTLAHHLVVWKACKNKRVDWKTLPYALLGDDLVINHKVVALEYCRLIRLLGVHWSKEKTHVSQHFYEFAKRIVWCGVDVTPFPLPALWSERKAGPIGLASVHDNASSKGWFSTADGIDSVWMGYFLALERSRSYSRKTAAKVKEAWIVISILRGVIPGKDLIPFIAKTSPIVANIISTRENQDEICLNLLLNTCMLLFSDSLETFYSDKNGEPLGLYAQELTIYLTGLEPPDPNWPIEGLPEALPHTHVWGRICEEFQKSQRRAYLLDTIKRGTWDKSFRNILLPTGDSKIYVNRSRDLVFTHTPKILKELSKQVSTLATFPQLI